VIDVEKLAREVGGSLCECDCVGGPEWHLSSRELERFARLVLEDAILLLATSIPIRQGLQPMHD